MSQTLNVVSASQVANVVPSVLSAGGTGLQLIGLMLNNDTRTPIGSVLSFPTAAGVGAYYGLSSQHYALALPYFGSFEGATVTPAAILFAQYPTTAVSAYIRGGSLAAMTLAQLQAISGTLIFTIDGASPVTISPNFASVTSFTAAAQLIETELATVIGPSQAAVTASITATTMTVTAISSGTLTAGQRLTGTSVTVGTFIAAQLTGTPGGDGTYTVTISQTVSSETITAHAPTTVFDSIASAFVQYSTTTGSTSTMAYVAGTVAASLDLTLATGAVLSQGAAAATPSAFMSGITGITQNWASFGTMFDPDGGSGNTNKLLFAAWTNAQNGRYAYVDWDTDITPTETVPATTSQGYILNQSESNGTILIYSPAQGPTIMAFVMGAIASIDFTQKNGRTNITFLTGSGITPDVTNTTVAANLTANGYNYYEIIGTANETVPWFYSGKITGEFQWTDSYVNEIWLTNQLQLAIITLFRNVRSIPYNPPGYALIKAGLQPVIDQAVNFGAFQPNVDLSTAQIAEVNQTAGANIAPTLQTQGWYLQVSPASAQVRAARGSPPCTLWYVDGGSVQQINLASIEVQ